MNDALNHDIYDLIERHGLGEVLQAIMWAEKARATEMVPAESTSAKTIPAARLVHDLAHTLRVTREAAEARARLEAWGTR
jgi:hypothetical protein